jgi:hypothetical protein
VLIRQLYDHHHRNKTITLRVIERAERLSHRLLSSPPRIAARHLFRLSGHLLQAYSDENDVARKPSPALQRDALETDYRRHAGHSEVADVGRLLAPGESGMTENRPAEEHLDFIKAQLVRTPTRGELARIALGIMFGAAGLVILFELFWWYFS